MFSRTWASRAAILVMALGGLALTAGVALGSGGSAQAGRALATAAPIDGEDLASDDRTGGALRAALDRLVRAGVISAEQRDRILKALAEELAADKRRRADAVKPKPPSRERSKPPRSAQPKLHLLPHLLRDAAGAIGVSPGQLTQELRSGKSLADVARAHGVSRDELVRKLVAAETARIREALDRGRISKETAERLERRLADAVAKAVDARRGRR